MVGIKEWAVVTDATDGRKFVAFDFFSPNLG
jgi:hypothetical protein